MPAVLPFVPMIASVIGLGGSIISGNQASAQNAQQIGLAQQSQQQQQQLIQQLMSGINPAAYQEQARQATMLGQGQIGADFAQRGMLDSGAMYTASANAAGKNYADAQARYQSDRVSAIGAAMGGQNALTRGYGDFVNPNPYAGMQASLGGLGTAAGQYAYQHPQAGGSGAGDPAFSVYYGNSGILGNWGR